MAVTLRLSRKGLPHHPFYRIVAAEKQKPRDGRFIEVVGTYNPMVNPPLVSLKEEKVRKWLEHGATPSSAVRDLIRKQLPGLIEKREENKLNKIRAARKARKARAAKRGGGKKAKAK